jgi:hypothetical protein
VSYCSEGHNAFNSNASTSSISGRLNVNQEQNSVRGRVPRVLPELAIRDRVPVKFARSQFVKTLILITPHGLKPGKLHVSRRDY